MKTIAVIPARYASTRMPGKPLADVLGKPMIWWVYQAAKACPKLDDVLIATDDERIADACKTYGMRYLMTSPDHDTPTGRIWEVSTVEDADLYLQLMGDEPLVTPAAFDFILPDTLPEDPCYVAVLTNIMEHPATSSTSPTRRSSPMRRGRSCSSPAAPSPTRKAPSTSSTRRSPASSCTASRRWHSTTPPPNPSWKRPKRTI